MRPFGCEAVIFETIKTRIRTVKQKGWRFCLFRAWYAVQGKVGILKKKCPAISWQELSFEKIILYPEKISFSEIFRNSTSFFFSSSSLPVFPGPASHILLDSAERILHNEFPFFFHTFQSLGAGPDWFLNPFTGARGTHSKHWSDIAHFDPQVGDIKFIWEVSRFSWVYILARAYAATKDERYAEKFWSLFEKWLNANPPNMGHNYVCGQECAIRVFAICFGGFAFANSPHTSQERIEKMLRALYVHADRIFRNISFAISTKTNHSITEAAGIFTAGLVFDFFRDAPQWRQRGKSILIKEGLKQIYEDGSYIQHSFNYHRLMLQDYLWVFRLAEIHEDPFPDNLTKRVKKAFEFLYQVQDSVSGRVPNYGANDGALILPLNDCDYLDFRPVLQACSVFFDKTKRYASGPWDEDLLWLLGDQGLRAEVKTAQRINVHADAGGYYTLHGRDSWVMMRCHSFTDRPGHSDMLHLDLWYKGCNILRDSGSYMYNCPEKWQRLFMGVVSHNTVSIDGQDQMVKGNLWNWFEWTKSCFLGMKQQGEIVSLSGEHYGYKRLEKDIVHRRTVYCMDSFWIVHDRVFGSGRHEIQLTWQLGADQVMPLSATAWKFRQGDHTFSLRIAGNENGKIGYYFGDEECPMGFQSLYYGTKEPAGCLAACGQEDLPVEWITLIGLDTEATRLDYDRENSRLLWLGHDGKEYRLNLNNEMEKSCTS